MDNIFLDSNKFSGRLNMENFVNIEKSYSTEELNRTFSADKFHILEKSGLDAFVQKIQDAVGGQVIKGGFNDTPEINNLIEKAKSDLSSMTRVLVNENGQNRHVFILEKSNKDELMKGKTGDELEKSHIDAFEYSDKIVFKKKGEDIIEKFKGAKIAEQAELDKYAEEIEKLSMECSKTPTEKADLWGSREGLVVPYKVFNWNQTYHNTDNRCYDSETNSAAAETPEEAENNRLYNRAVDKWVSSAAEIRTIDLYINNLDPKKEYELTSRQMMALKF